jgi:hypothetical protein
MTWEEARELEDLTYLPDDRYRVKGRKFVLTRDISRRRKKGDIVEFVRDVKGRIASLFEDQIRARLYISWCYLKPLEDEMENTIFDLIQE